MGLWLIITDKFWNFLFFLFIASCVAFIILVVLGFIEFAPLHPDAVIIDLPP